MGAVYNTLFYLLLVPTTAGGLRAGPVLLGAPSLFGGWLAGAGAGTHFNAHSAAATSVACGMASPCFLVLV